MTKNLIPVYFKNLKNPVSCLLDLGADISCLKTAHFHRLGLQMKDLSKSDIKYIRGAGGGTHTILGQILLPIRVADIELMHRFYVIDQLGYNCLFGIDFLQQNKVQISYKNNTVTINHMNKQVAINMISEPNSKARLRENSTIPPGTIRTVAIHLPFSNIDTDRSLLLTPTSKLNDLQIGML